jgi:radical SAM protein with 4Fe4S-binding SPASM domain
MYIDRAVLEINGGCNYTCQMCPQTTADGKTGARGKSWLKKMSIGTFEDLIIQSRPKVVNLDGSGEATLNNDLPKYIEIVKKHGSKAYIFSNGYKMRGQFMRDCVDAGLDFFRFSIIGYNEETYRKWMNASNFNWVTENMYLMREYAQDCMVSSYHLILNNNEIEYEKQQYLKVANGGPVEIWKMHNWSGVYTSDRKGKKKTCGRPFSPDAVVRANGAVHPCCQVLGRDDEAILGNIHDNTLEDIWHGETYEKLREDHRTGNYPSFCKDCDFLIDDPEVLVYSNYAQEYKMNGSEFTLNEYR